MKNFLSALTLLIFFLLCTFSCTPAVELPPFVVDPPTTEEDENNDKVSEYRNFYGMSFLGDPAEHLAYARQMGYKHVFYRWGMEDVKLSDDMYFYLESPEYSIYYPYDPVLDTKKNYSADEIKWYENYGTLKNTGSFPDCIATGWFSSETAFSVQLNFQQDMVINWAVEKILALAKRIETSNPKLHFIGYAWDVPDLTGDFWDGLQSKAGRQITLAHWTGGDFGSTKGRTHDYATYSDGRVAFYKALYAATREKYPDMKVIHEPYSIWDQWIRIISRRDDVKEIMPDVMAQEGAKIDFLTDGRIYATGLIDKENTCYTATTLTEESNRINAANVAMHKAWSNYYGRFGGSNGVPNYKSVTEIPRRILLAKVLPNWENMNNTALEDRQWDGKVYQSPTAYMSDGVISVIQPKTGKLFVVFLKENGAITLPEGKVIKNIYRTDGIFKETVNGKTDFIINNNTLKSASADILNNGYIISFQS